MRPRPKPPPTHNSAGYLHHLIETMRLAFADARAYVADPSHEAIPLSELLSPEYAASRARLVDPHRAKANVKAGSPYMSSDTVPADKKSFFSVSS